MLFECATRKIHRFPFASGGLTTGVPTIPMLIYTSVDLPIQQAIARAWGAALMLMLIILIANVGARVMLARTRAKMGT